MALNQVLLTMVRLRKALLHACFPSVIIIVISVASLAPSMGFAWLSRRRKTRLKIRQFSLGILAIFSLCLIVQGILYVQSMAV